MFILFFICLSFSSITQAINFVENQVIVKFKPNAQLKGRSGFFSGPLKDPVLGKYKIKKTRPLDQKKRQRRSFFGGAAIQSGQEIMIIEFDEFINPINVSKDFSSSDQVEYAQPNFKYSISLPTQLSHTISSQSIPNDTLFNDQRSDLSLINVFDLWDVSTGNSEVVIAVIDTGVLYTHEDLENSMWVNPGEIANNGVDDDGNGFEDDIFGWNFNENNNDPIDRKVRLDDINGHGTHIAGIIAAQSNNQLGVAGVCSGCKIMALQAGKNNDFSTETISNAIDYAVANNADIINMSFGGIFDLSDPATAASDQLLEERIENAKNNDVICVAAAGNDKLNVNDNHFVPAVYSNVFTVSAADNNGDFVAAWNAVAGSNFGQSVDIMAPGTSILSTYINLNSQNNVYNVIDGTSMAAPMISGALGLLKSIFPRKLNIELLNSITQNSVDKGNAGYDIFTGHGLVNVNSSAETLDTGSPIINHNNVNSINIGDRLVVTASVTDESLVSLSLFYKLKEGITFPQESFTEQPLNNINDVFSYTFDPFNSDTTEVEYYFQATDSFFNQAILPTTAPAIPYFSVLEDVSGPVISSQLINNDHINPNTQIQFNIFDNVGLNTNALQVTINYSGGVHRITNITVQTSAVLQNHILSVDLTSLDFNDDETITLDIFAVDVNGLSTQFSQSLRLSSQSIIYGPHDGTSPVVNVPNPFDPNKESTTFSYQTSKVGIIKISIYSLNFELIKLIERSVGTGPSDGQDSWDGRDISGRLVPNGVYPFVLEYITSQKRIVKRGKIAVLRN